MALDRKDHAEMYESRAHAPLNDPPKSRLVADTGAAVVVEYALLGGLVALIAIAALLAFAAGNDGLWAMLETELGGAMRGD